MRSKADIILAQETKILSDSAAKSAQSSTMSSLRAGGRRAVEDTHSTHAHSANLSVGGGLAGRAERRAAAWAAFARTPRANLGTLFGTFGAIWEGGGDYAMGLSNGGK